MSHYYTDTTMYKRGDIYWASIKDRLGATRRVSLETRDEKSARAMEAWLTEVYERLDRHGVLSAIIRGDLTPAQAFALGEAGAAAEVARLQAEREDWAITDDMLAAWQQQCRKDGVSERTAAEYRKQVETLWPAPRRLSWLKPPTIKAALRALPCGEATKSRYKAALSSLVHWMLEEDLLTENPMVSVPGFAQSAVRDLWYTREQALLLLNHLPEPYRSIEATMYACGWEWAAIARATAKDFDLAALTAHAHGTKTKTRDRLTVITDLDVVPWLLDAKAGKLPYAPMWPGVRNDTCLKVHQQACRDLNLPVTTLHDWRHTFAVLNVKAGRSIHFVAQMLGHANTMQAHTRYARHALSAGEVRQVARELAQTAHKVATQ